MKIVSANYRDRDSAYRWLVRDEHEPAEKAVAFKAVRASGVRFSLAMKYEVGFGCQVVARCVTAEGSDPRRLKPQAHPELKGRRLTFDFDSFYDDDGRRVTGCSYLDLDTDGSMLAFMKRR